MYMCNNHIAVKQKLTYFKEIPMTLNMITLEHGLQAHFN